MDFSEATKTLGIEDYSQRIFNSNSHGQLFHLVQYIHIAETFKDNPGWFREWFESVVKEAEDTWDRPVSVFQHILRILVDSVNAE